MLTLMQGASGSGKSTVAKELAAQTGAVIYSTDELFIENGLYKFNPKMLGIYHQKNLERTIEALKAGKDVIVDNTNTQRWECKPYVEAALRYGHEIKFVRCDGRYQNVHGVPNEKVEQMRCRLEDLTVEKVLASKKPF
jgi:predicted kinase